MTDPVPMELAIDGPAAPPRTNGELAFDAPWQSRVFGLTAALVEAGHLGWPDFQAALIARVALADAAGHDRYWDCWTEALGDCCEQAGLVEPDQLDERVVLLEARPSGHDHRHD